MPNRGSLIIGGLFIFFGLLFLVGEIFDVNVWAVCWPLGLIFLGLWVALRPQLVGPGTNLRFKLLGDVHRTGVWQPTDEEIWLGVGDIDLDLTQAELAMGETSLRLIGFVSSVELVAPKDVGVLISSTGFLTDAKVLDRKHETFFATYRATSENYDTAERKVRLELNYFVVDLKVKQV